MANKTTPIPTEPTSVPFTPDPDDRLLFGGALLGWAFLVLTIVGLGIFGFAYHQKQRQLRFRDTSNEQSWRGDRVDFHTGAKRDSARDIEANLEMLGLIPMPRAAGRVWKMKTNVLPGYEEASRDMERRKAYARLTGSQDVDGRGIIG